MRMSVKKGDIGYFKYAREFSVFLNGEEVVRAHTADEELGKVWINDVERFKSDRAKSPWATYDLQGNITNELELHSKELTGNVEIRRKCKTS